MQRSRKQQGFTLIELSVVIVIIGLLITGVMAGQHLVQQASIRQSIAALKSVENGINLFREKYSAWPGDMPNATTQFTSALVKNGNGDEGIAANQFAIPSAAVPQETAQALVHLSQGQFIQGSYTGVGALESGTNIVSAGDDRMLGVSATVYFDRRGNVITIAKHRTAIPYCFWCNAAFSVQEAKTIDGKIDDGIANSGVLYAIDGDDAAGGCSAIWSNVTGADYVAVTSEAKTCRLFYSLIK